MLLNKPKRAWIGAPEKGIMASRSVSPGGALLRASRVFSMPPPLPRPSPDLSSMAIFQSDTATLPHPIHLSVATPQSSLSRGDWGFKRPLPLRSTTRTSTPIIRVESIDTLEHITEFGSAADHSLTLQKWQELGLPITTPSVEGVGRGPTPFAMRGEAATNKSVFEDNLDTTVVTERGLLDKDDTRWKFKGPWLAGVTEGEFQSYIDSQVRGRKQEFREFLRTACAESMTRKVRRQATDEEGESPPSIQASDVTEQEIEGYVRELRKDITTLYGLIRKFLDLPPPPNVKVSDSISSLVDGIGGRPANGAGLNLDDLSVSNSPYANTGPPKTHPSAGLGYSRSSAYLVNHPVHGPQKHKTPVEARIVMPKNASVGNFSPVLGVAGFVTPVPNEPSFNFKSSSAHKIGGRNSAVTIVSGLVNIDSDKVGGSKTWVQPKSAMVDSKGRVILSVEGAHPDAVAVKTNKTHEIPEPQYMQPVVQRSRARRETSNRGFGITSADFQGDRNVKG